ncbi:MAG: hypothetical protein JNM40_21570 [Myxococcales bacterium]|jgi:hypothetical protein|nr:hypothetical protein [Myxococcales bacterium]
MANADKDDFLGWTPKEAADRALQAVCGLVCIASGGRRDDILPQTIRAHVETMSIVAESSDAENLELVREQRAFFERVLGRGRIAFLSGEPRRLWRLFVERYDLRTFQLRASLSDILDCFDMQELGQRLGRSESYLRRLPPSSELVIAPWKEGVRADLVIPPRLLVLDMILMLKHALVEHRRLELADKRGQSEGRFRIDNEGRLDSYARQALILSASICDNVLTEYGYIVVAVLKGVSRAPEMLSKIENVQKQGVTARLRTLPQLWTQALDRASVSPTDAVRDMLLLIEIRNRLVHPDGRVNCWYAFQIDPTRASWQFSDRIGYYLDKPVSYRLSGSNIGYEFALAEFCVDTVLLVIDYLHSVLHPDDRRTPWLDLPRIGNGGLDLKLATDSERILQIGDG